MDYVVLTLRSCGVLGLSAYEPCSTVVPASMLLYLVEEPRIRDDQWDASYRREQWKKTLETLEAWGEAMVEVRSFGAVCGEFSVQPYLISEDQYYALRKMRCA